MGALLDEAIKWMGRGIAVIPCYPGTKRAAVRWTQYQTSLPSYADVYRWFGEQFGNKNFNLAVVTGHHGLVVIDFDNLDAWGQWWGQTRLDTYTVATARGVHVYLWVNEAVQSTKIPGVLDIKANGGYVLAPPAIHPSGIQYQVLQDLPILRVNSLRDVIALPEKPAPVQQNVSFPAKDLDPWERASVASYRSQSLVESIRSKVKILSFFPDAQQTGEHWWMATCPFHDDKHPSFWIDTRRELCGCHAGCTSKPMDVINLFARMQNIDNRTAIDELRKLAI